MQKYSNSNGVFSDHPSRRWMIRGAVTSHRRRRLALNRLARKCYNAHSDGETGLNAYFRVILAVGIISITFSRRSVKGEGRSPLVPDGQHVFVSFSLGWCMVYRFQIGGVLLPVFFEHIYHRVSYHVEDAALIFRLRKRGCYRLFYPAESVRAHNDNVSHASVLKLIQPLARFFCSQCH